MEKWIVTKAQESKTVQVKNKVMLIVSSNFHGIVDIEFLPQGQTINQNVYKDILQRLMHSVREKRRDLWEMKSWVHHDNALNIWEFLAKNTIAVLEQLPCSPDLAPCDFFLFPKVKGVIKRSCFQDSLAIITVVMKELQAIPEESFQECMEA